MNLVQERIYAFQIENVREKICASQMEKEVQSFE